MIATNDDFEEPLDEDLADPGTHADGEPAAARGWSRWKALAYDHDHLAFWLFSACSTAAILEFERWMR